VQCFSSYHEYEFGGVQEPVADERCPPSELTAEQKTTLQAWANGRKALVRLAERSQILLFAAEGTRDIDFAAALSITLAKAVRWRNRDTLEYSQHGCRRRRQ
jgi:hypothetical protein